MIKHAQTQRLIWCGLIAALFVAGVYLRLFQVDAPPYWIDEAFSIESTKKSLDLDSMVQLRAWLYHQILGISILTFGESTLSTRFPSVIASMLGIVAIGWLCLKQFGRLPALAAMTIMALGIWHIAWARQVREYPFLMSSFWLAMAFLHAKLLASPKKTRQLSDWLKQVCVIALLALVVGLIHPFGLLVFAAGVLALLLNKLRQRQAQATTALNAPLIWTAALFFGNTVLLWLSLKNEPAYAGFILKEYWYYGWLALPALSLIFNQRHRWFVLWVLSIVVIGLSAISWLVPLTNLRYLYFLTPLTAVLVAASVAALPKKGEIYGAITAISFLAYFGALVLMPQKSFALETLKTDSGYRYYTPQPKFNLAYAYINNRLAGKDLVTPYPAISRRYRDIDDTLALNAKVSFTKNERGTQVKTEYYSGLPFANGSVLVQLAKQQGSIYILVDQMALERMDRNTTTVITQQGELVREWRKRPYSSLFLYKLSSSS